jgi:hypothetical protein
LIGFGPKEWKELNRQYEELKIKENNSDLQTRLLDINLNQRILK